MASVDIRPLSDDLAFGARISGVTYAALEDATIRQQIYDVFEDRGLIVFEDVDPTGKMHLTLSNIFGPLKDHPVPAVGRVDQDAMPGVIDMKHVPGTGSVTKVNGKLLSSWLPWHFDHCYNNELNRAGVLRALEVTPEGGLTLFADGIELYQAISPELRARIEGHNILYSLKLGYDVMRFGRPADLEIVKHNPEHAAVSAQADVLPRAVHPAVWTRQSGEKVLHVSPWMSQGIEGHEDAAGDALLEEVCQEIIQKAHAYTHQWKTTDMLIWDNWRVLHAVSGSDPSHKRRMHRTTIKGDYGLGYFENGGVGNELLEMTV